MKLSQKVRRRFFSDTQYAFVCLQGGSKK